MVLENDFMQNFEKTQENEIFVVFAEIYLVLGETKIYSVFADTPCHVKLIDFLTKIVA